VSNRAKSLAPVERGMGETLRPEDLEARCERLQYPVMRADAAAACADVTVDQGDTEANLGVVISELAHDSFTNADELHDAIVAALDAHGVGNRE
jgi:hypothetical protein